MVVGFCFIGDWCYSEWWVWGLITLAVSGKWNVSRVIPRLYGWVYKISKLLKLLIELWVLNQGYSQSAGSQSVIITVGSQLGGSQFQSLGLLIFNSRFIKFVLRISAASNFEILEEDSGTGSPRSIIVRIECLFACQFWYCEICVKNRCDRGRKHYFVNFCFVGVL